MIIMGKTLQFVNGLGLSILMSFVGLQAAAQVPATVGMPQVREVALTNNKPHSATQPAKAAAYDNEVVVDGVRYAIDKTENKAVVLGFAGESVANLNLADEVTVEGTNYPVTEIGDSAFTVNPTITSIRFPEGLKKIGGWAFDHNRALTSVTLPDALESIEIAAFWQCSSLTDVQLAPNMTKLGDYAFYQDSALTTNIEIPATVTYIGDRTFNQCTSLSSIKFLGDEIGNLQYMCFGATNISEMILPKKVNRFGNAMFWDCHNLAHVVLPQNITELPLQTFVNCFELKGVELGENITKLGNACFFNSGVTTEGINLEHITYIDMSAFAYCVGLTGTVVLGDNTTFVGNFAFGGSAITGFKAGSGLEELDEQAIYNCKNLENVELNEGLTKTGRQCFGFDPKLTELTIPSTVTIVEGGAFVYSPELKLIVCNAYNPPVCQNVDEDLSNDYTFTTLCVPDDRVDAYKAAKYWKNYTILPMSEKPRYATVTHNGAVYNLNLNKGTAVLTDGKATTGDFVVPNVITEQGIDCTVVGIGKGAFDENTNLTSITLNADLDSIAEDAFQYSSIPALHLGAKVRTVGHDFHYKATSLAEITVDENNPYLCAENSLLMSKDKKAVWGFPVANPATELILPEEVEIVKSDACNRCKNLTKIVINDNCKTIEREGFDNCTNCTELVLGKGIEFIGYQAFRNYNQMLSLTMPDNLKEIDAWAFSWCQSLKEITFNNKLEKIGNGSFYHNDMLEVVDLPASLTTVDAYAFNTCDNIIEMRCHATVPPTVSIDFWENQDYYNTIPLLVPAGSEQAYANAEVWQKFTNVDALPFSAIEAVEAAGDATVVGIYTLDGRKVSELQMGVNIVRMSDGTSRKVIK